MYPRDCIEQLSAFLMKKKNSTLYPMVTPTGPSICSELLKATSVRVWSH